MDADEFAKFWRIGLTAGGPGWRVRVAYLPVRLWTIVGRYAEPTKKIVWFKRIVEVDTLSGWVAYADHQQHVELLYIKQVMYRELARRPFWWRLVGLDHMKRR